MRRLRMRRLRRLKRGIKTGDFQRRPRASQYHGALIPTSGPTPIGETAHSLLVLWILHGVISGCYYTSTASLGQRLFPHSKYAQFASAAGILGAIGTMFVGPAVSLVVDTVSIPTVEISDGSKGESRTRNPSLLTLALR